MARPPTWLDRWNFISFFLSNPCNFPWIVYFETAWRPLGRLVLRFLTFGLLDVIRGFFRPKGLRSGRHGRKSRRGRRQAVPEIAELVARRIPGQDAVASRQVSDGVRHLWRIDAVVQRVAYYLMVVDIFSEWWTAWQSAIIRDERSSCEGVGRALREGDFLVTSSGGWGIYLTGDLVYSQGPVSLSVGSCAAATGKWMITITGKAAPFQPDPLGVTMQLAIRNTADMSQFLGLSSREVLFGSDTADMIATVYLNAPFNVTFAEYTQNGSPINYAGAWTEITAFAMQMGD